MSSNEIDRVNAGVGLGIGSEYDPSTLTIASTAAAAETSRVNAGVGLGAGSQTDFTNVAATSSASADEQDRHDTVGGDAGIGGGSQANF